MGKKEAIKEVMSVLGKILIVILVVVAFYKLPAVVADKLTYEKLKKRSIK